MKHDKKILEDKTIEITLTIPWKDVKATYDKVFADVAKTVEVKGFRKGKAPKNLVEKQIQRSAIYEEVIKKLIPDAYADVVKKESLKPIIHPKIELKKAKENEDWVIIARTCEKPKLTIGDYKKAIAKVKKETGKKIWTPDQKEEEKKEEKGVDVNTILSALITVIKGRIPSVLIEQEVNRQLSDLVDRTKQLGLTVDQYLASTGKTQDSIKKEYEQQSKQSLILEFALEDIANQENIAVTDKDLDELIEKTAKNDKEKENLQNQRYYLASVLRRQKTIEHLTK